MPDAVSFTFRTHLSALQIKNMISQGENVKPETTVSNDYFNIHDYEQNDPVQGGKVFQTRIV